MGKRTHIQQTFSHPNLSLGACVEWLWNVLRLDCTLQPEHQQLDNSVTNLFMKIGFFFCIIPSHSSLPAGVRTQTGRWSLGGMDWSGRVDSNLSSPYKRTGEWGKHSNHLLQAWRNLREGWNEEEWQKKEWSVRVTCMSSQFHIWMERISSASSNFGDRKIENVWPFLII